MQEFVRKAKKVRAVEVRLADKPPEGVWFSGSSWGYKEAIRPGDASSVSYNPSLAREGDWLIEAAIPGTYTRVPGWVFREQYVEAKKWDPLEDVQTIDLIWNCGYFPSIWTVEDVQSLDERLTDDQAKEVLVEFWSNHDAERGTNWNTLQEAIDTASLEEGWEDSEEDEEDE